MRPAAGCSGRGSPRASLPWGPAPPPRPIHGPGPGARRRVPSPSPAEVNANEQRSPPSLRGPQSVLFEPDANLTLTSIIRSALGKLVVSSPPHPTPSPAPATRHHSFHPRPLPPSPSGEHGEGSTLQDRTSQADRSIRPGPRTHARTHTAPHTAPSYPPCNQPPSTALHTRPRAGRPT